MAASISNDSEQEVYNFCLPIDISKLQTDRLRLVAFNSNLSLFANLYVSLLNSPESVGNFAWLPYGPFASTVVFLQWYDAHIQSSKAVTWFAVIVNEAGIESVRATKSEEGTRAGEESVTEALVEDGGDGQRQGWFAGVVGYLNTDAGMGRVEVGHLNILPAFRRTFVATHAIGVLLNYLLEPVSSGCLQVRRVEWLANVNNKPSTNAALRLGFTQEGVMRWHRILPKDREGQNDCPDGKGPRRDTWMSSVCWDDWEGGVRNKVKALMAR